MKTILEKFFPFFNSINSNPAGNRLSLSGGTGALQPLPMQISDAERFRDLVASWSCVGDKRQGDVGSRVLLFGNTTFPPQKKLRT